MISDDERRAIEQDCQKLALTSIHLNDMQRWDALSDLFIENARFARPTAPADVIEGREAIRAGFKARPVGRITRHLITNLIVDVVDGDHARCRMYATLFTGDTANPAHNPAFGLLADHNKFIGIIEDDYVRTPAGWRIEERSGSITFLVE